MPISVFLNLFFFPRFNCILFFSLNFHNNVGGLNIVPVIKTLLVSAKTFLPYSFHFEIFQNMAATIILVASFWHEILRLLNKTQNLQNASSFLNSLTCSRVSRYLPPGAPPPGKRVDN